MYATLMTGAIGIKGLTLEDSIALAADTGFEGVWFDIREAKALADAHGVQHVKKLFTDKGVRPGGWGAPVAWQDDSKRDADLEALKPLADLGVELGNPFTTTGIMPGSNERPFDEQYAFIVERLRPYAAALDACGVRLGIEFIAPKTIRDRFQYEFIYSLQHILKLAEDVGTGNIGALFDVWHHYTSHGTVDEVSRLTVDDVQVVHVNDAPEGLDVDEQIDSARTLPAVTGVIPAADMLKRLDDIGFAGPVIAEPFNQRLNDLAASDPVAAAKETRTSIATLFARAGLA